MGALVACLLAWGAGGNDTVLLAFSTDTCPPCRQMAPIVEQFAAAGYPVRKVNLSQEPALARHYRVDRVPCCVMLVEGREVDRVVGPVPAERITRMFALAAPVPSLRGASVQLASAPSGPPRTIPAVQSATPFLTPSPSGAAAGATLSPNGLGPGGRPPATPTDRAAAGDSAAASLSPSAVSADLSGQLLAATVRLRVSDATGHSRGTGTMIDAREDRALVLTCGHIFRDSQGKGEIEVDLFSAARVERVQGRLIHYDLDADLALLSIPAVGPIQVARVAPAGFVVRKGDKVYNVGCNHGENPTVRQSHITAIDKFVGHPNLEASGAPVQGRSGGGLFSADGYLIGVCNAAVPTDNEGMYAGFKTVHAILAQKRLGHVCPEGAGAGATPLEVVRDLPRMPAKMPPPGQLRSPTDSRTPGGLEPLSDDRTNPNAPVDLLRGRGASVGSTGRIGGVPGPLSPDEQAALDLIARRKAEGDEVICIIRSREKPSASSEIVVIDNASAAFVDTVARGRPARGAAPSAEVRVPVPTVRRENQSGARETHPAESLDRRPTSRDAVPAGPIREMGGRQFGGQDIGSQGGSQGLGHAASASDQGDWKPRWLTRASASRSDSPASGSTSPDPRVDAVAATATALSP